jgi:hypothetical protein
MESRETENNQNENKNLTPTLGPLPQENFLVSSNIIKTLSRSKN